MAMNDPAPTYPARAFMRPQRINLGAQAFTLGGAATTFELRKIGYCTKLIVHAFGTYTGANASLVFLNYAPYSLVKLFTLVTPGSPLPPFNAGGWTMHQWNLVASDFAPYRLGFRRPGAKVAGGAAVGSAYSLDESPSWAALTDQFPTSVAAHTMHLWWELPFALSATDIRGILPLGNASTTTLTITPNTAADLVTVPANLTVPVFSIEVVQEILTPPPAGAQSKPLDLTWVQAFDENDQAIVATGLQQVEIVPNYTFLGILHGVTVNGGPSSAAIDSLNLRLNSSWLFEPPGITGTQFMEYQAMAHGVELPEGVFMYDQDAMGLVPGANFGYDWINTSQITEIDSQLVVDAATVLGVLPRIRTSVRRLVKVA